MVWCGFKAFKIWVACQAHFTKESFDILKFKGRIRGKYETYITRNDSLKFDYVSKKFTEQDWLYICASNMMYGNFNVVYDLGKAIANYNLFSSRQDSFTHMIRHDYDVFNKYGVKKNDCKGILRLLTQNLITFETVVVLNKVIPITETIREDSSLKFVVQILNPLLLRIDKADIFIYTPKERIDEMKQNSFNSDSTFNSNIFSY